MLFPPRSPPRRAPVRSPPARGLSSWRALVFAVPLFVASGCFYGSGVPPDPAPPDAGSTTNELGLAGPPVRLATFNVQRFFDPVCDTGDCGVLDYEEVLSDTRFYARAAEVADGLRDLAADIYCLQEIETASGLAAIGAALGPAYETVVFGETGAPGSVDVGVLARGTLTAVHTWRDTPLFRPNGSETRFARELLEVHTSHAGARVITLCAHFKSKFNDDPGRRVAEAQAAREIARAAAQRHPSALVVLAGDLNDTPGSVPLRELERGGHLQRVASDIGDAANTYVYRGTPQAIDHLYVVVDGGGGYVPLSAQVQGFPDGYALSDHAALLADFRAGRPRVARWPIPAGDAVPRNPLEPSSDR